MRALEASMEEEEKEEEVLFLAVEGERKQTKRAGVGEKEVSEQENRQEVRGIQVQERCVSLVEGKTNAISMLHIRTWPNLPPH